MKELHYLDNLNRTRRFFPPRSRDGCDASFLDSIKSLSEQSHIDLERYGQLFRHKGARLSGDISPAYSTLNEEVIERVLNHFPDVKVIFLARDPVERAWSQLSMGVRLGMINRFDATDADAVVRNLLNPGVLARSHPSKTVARWKRYIRPELFRVYFFDDLEKHPVQLRRSILDFLGADTNKPGAQIKAKENNDVGKNKPPLTAKVRSHVARFFERELKACAVELGGHAKKWPARYGFSLLFLFSALLDDSIDLLF